MGATAPAILVVDDEAAIVHLLRAYLEKSGFRVLTAYSGETVLPILRHDRPVLIILDLMLPDQDGWEITRRVRGDSGLAAIPIIMLTARIDDSDKIIGLELGADDYITKPFNPSEVVARVRAVLRRTQGDNAAKPPELLHYADLSMDLQRHEFKIKGKLVELTVTEFDLLKILLENPRHAFTRSELIELALGYDYEGSERTLDSHMRNLRRKIEPDAKRATYIQTIYGVGYCLDNGDQTRA